MKKILPILLVVLTFLTIGSAVSFAHVVIKPSEVGMGAFQTFMMGVPVEKDTSTTGLRLVLPEGLHYVTPNVKPGWDIEIKKEGEGEEARVTEINWTNGSIPAGQRDDFVFSAQVPSSEATLHWRVYQIYEDGSIVAWDKDPSTIKAGEEGTPYSQTKIINDLKNTDSSDTKEAGEKTNNAALTISIVAFVFSLIALGLSRKKH